MPKIVTPQTLKLDSDAHARRARQAATDARKAIEADDYPAAIEAAKTLEAAGCYIRRAVGRLDA
jgi:hypothetical protein